MVARAEEFCSIVSGVKSGPLNPLSRTESEYQLRLKDNQYQEESLAKGKHFSSQISDLRQNIHKLNNDIETNKKTHDNAIIKLKESNEKGGGTRFRGNRKPEV